MIDKNVERVGDSRIESLANKLCITARNGRFFCEIGCSLGPEKSKKETIAITSQTFRLS